jgi:transposase InsO family protein
VHRVLTRHGMPRLAWLDRPSREPVRYERDRPGELVHVASRSWAACATVAAGGCTAATATSDGAPTPPAPAGNWVGHEFVHSAIEDHSRLAYAQIHPDERAHTCAGFLRRAAAWFAHHGIPRIERVMTDNAMAYRRSRAWREALAELDAQSRFTRRYRPQTNCEGVGVLLRAA